MGSAVSTDRAISERGRTVDIQACATVCISARDHQSGQIGGDATVNFKNTARTFAADRDTQHRGRDRDRFVGVDDIELSTCQSDRLCRRKDGRIERNRWGTGDKSIRVIDRLTQAGQSVIRIDHVTGRVDDQTGGLEIAQCERCRCCRSNGCRRDIVSTYSRIRRGVHASGSRSDRCRITNQRCRGTATGNRVSHDPTVDRLNGVVRGHGDGQWIRKCRPLDRCLGRTAGNSRQSKTLAFEGTDIDCSDVRLTTLIRRSDRQRRLARIDRRAAGQQGDGLCRTAVIPQR